MTVVFVDPKTAAQRATREPERCHYAGPGSCCATCLQVCAGCFPSLASERRNRIFHSPSVLVEQIPFARCFQCQTFATFSVVVPVEGRQERSSSSTDIHPFLKSLNHSYVCVWPRALSPNAPLSILCVSEAVLPSLKQNLMQIRCSSHQSS